MEEAVGLGAGVVTKATATHRQCSVEIVNACTNHTLSNPRTYVHSGHCSKPPSPLIQPSKVDVSTFEKTTLAPCGAVGVVMYDLQENVGKRCRERVAVMFSVPFDFNVFRCWFAVGVFDKTKECDKKLFEQMYYKADPTFIRGKAGEQCLTHKGDWFTVMATMSDSARAYLKLRVSDNQAGA